MRIELGIEPQQIRIQYSMSDDVVCHHHCRTSGEISGYPWHPARPPTGIQVEHGAIESNFKLLAVDADVAADIANL